MKTEIAVIDPITQRLPDGAVLSAAEIIKRGGLVVFPTETVYGLGADATNAEAVKKIFIAKGRPSDNPLIIHLSAPSDAIDYVFAGELYFKLAERFMPGPLTVIMQARDNIPMETRGGLPTVAVRCPANATARELIRLSGVPIAAPSANISGSPSPTALSHVVDDMQGRVDMIIDGGECDFGLESTIIKIEDDDTLTLLRPGKITPDELKEIAPVHIADAVLDRLAAGAVALSPGMKYRHYAPASPVILLEGEVDAVIKYVGNDDSSSIALISYSEDIDILSSALCGIDIYELGARDDEETQAHNLFSLLRELDKKSYEKIYAPIPKKTGIGLALYNRMIRAAAHTIIKL